MVALMTLHHTNFISALYAERANILSAQGLLSKRLVALDELLAVYGAKHVPGEDSIIAHAQELPASPAPGEVATAGATSSGEVELPPSASPATSSTGASQKRAQTATGLGAGGDHLDPTSRPTATAKTDAPSDQSQASGGGQSQDNSGVRVASVDTVSETPAPSPGSEAAVDDADAAPAGGASRPDASPAPTSTRQRVKQLHDEHPEYTRREAWEALGITEGSLSGHSSHLGIRWASQPEPARFTPHEPVATPAPRPLPKGTQFRLRAGRGEGKYLHMSGIGMTDNKTYAWIGTESQLVAVRRKFPEARELYDEVVEKEPAR
jgi:hypothetical protein